MNGYDAQDMATQGADGFRNGYQAGYADAVKAIEAAQPAAAQEAVAWLSKDEAQLALFKAIQAIRFGNPTDDKMILDNLRHEGLWIGRYANAPVTAAPGIDMGVPGATLTIDGETFTVDEVRAALLPGASPKDELESWKRGTKACAEVLGQVMRQTQDSPKGGSDPWRGLYARERAPNRDEYGCFYHPDIPSWDDEREESIAPLLKAQGFDLQCVPGDFSDEAMEEGGERYWQEMREWNPEPEGDGWRLVAICDTEDGPYSMFVKPLAQAGDAEVQP